MPSAWRSVVPYAEDVGEEVRGEDLQYRSGRDHRAFVEDDEVVAEAGGEVEVVQHGEGGDPGAADQVEEFEPGPDVEVVGELVQHEQLGLLGQRAGEQDALAFAAGQGGVVAVREGAYAAAVDRVGHGLVVLGAVPAEQPVVRGAAEGDDLGDGQAGGVAGRPGGRRRCGGPRRAGTVPTRRPRPPAPPRPPGVVNGRRSAAGWTCRCRWGRRARRCRPWRTSRLTSRRIGVWSRVTWRWSTVSFIRCPAVAASELQVQALVAAQQPQEEGGAEQGGEDAQRQFVGADDGAGEQVDEDQVDGAEERGQRAAAGGGRRRR